MVKIQFSRPDQPAVQNETPLWLLEAGMKRIGNQLHRRTLHQFSQVMHSSLEGYIMAYTGTLTVCLFVLLSKANVTAAFGPIHFGNFLQNFSKMLLLLQYMDNKTSKSCACIGQI
jgi:hypothetical protein